MTDSRSWWERKLGAPGAPPARVSPVSTSQFGPGVVPRGLGQNQQAAVNDYLWRQQQALPQEEPIPQGYVPPDPRDPHGNHAPGRVWQWRGNPRGGAGDSAITGGNCPECGSARYFSRKHGSVATERGVMMPSPECMDCGYGVHVGGSAIEQGILATGATSSGSAQRARSAEAAPPPGSLASLRRPG